jgi:hypothetical protein
MTQRNFTARLAKLESRLRPTGQSEYATAYYRAVDVLTRLLPEIPGAWHRVQVGPAAYKVVTDVPRVTSWSRMQGLGTRIEANDLADDDRATLAALELHAEAELRLMECTAAAFAEHWGRMLREFEASV